MNICVTLPDWVDAVARPGTVCATDEEKMAIAVALAAENVSRGGGPFGAVVFHRPSGRLVSGGVNLVLQSGLSCFHAEVTTLSAAQTRLGRYDLSADGGHELVTSSEPCAMCLGAVLWSGVKRVVCGACCDAARAIGFDEGPVFPESWAYLRRAGIEVVEGVLCNEAEAVLKRYQEQGGVVYNA